MWQQLLSEIQQGNIKSLARTISLVENEYDRYFDYRVVDAKLKKVDRDAVYRVQLQKSTAGFLVAKGHASLLVEDDYEDTEHYEYRKD